MAVDCITPEEFKAKYGSLPVGETADDVRIRFKEQAIKNKENLVANQKIHSALVKYLDAAENPEEALINLLRPDRVNKANGRGTTTLEFEQDVIMHQAHAELISMMHEYKPFLGIKPITDSDPRNIVRALYGNTVDDPHAAKFAEIWNNVVNKMVDRFNRAGGNIAKRDDWNLPQIHSVIKIAEVPKNEWVGKIYEKLDFKKMKLDNASVAERESVLGQIYDTLSTNGLNKEVKNRGVKIANRRNKQRVLQFKDAESWLKYQDEFGNQNVYSSLMDYINGMAKDIAAMEKFGSDPEAMLRTIADHAIKNSKDPTKAVNRVERAQKIWDNTMGHTSALDTKFAHRGALVRNIMSATKLGSAILSAFSDISMLAITSAFNDMPITKPIMRMMRNIANGKSSDYTASRLLLGLEHAIDAAHTANRYSDVVGHGASSKFADFVIRSSGLNHWTVSAKQAFGVEFIAHITQALKKGTGNKIFKMYGIDDADIAVLKKAKTFNDNGTELLDVQELDNELMKKVVAMTIAETRMAVPEPDMGVKAILNQGTRSGTWVGEIARSATQFKSFPATMITGHLARMWNQTGGNKGRLVYGASLVASTTFMGMFAATAKDVLNKGEAPTKDSINANLLFRGFVQGGSGPFIMDILESQTSDLYKGQGLTEMLAGPSVGTLDKILFRIAFGEGKKVASGKKDPSEAAITVGTKLLEEAIPNLPFIKLAIQREVISSMHQLGDSKWKRQQRSYQRKRLKETNNQYWYKP